MGLMNAIEIRCVKYQLEKEANKLLSGPEWVNVTDRIINGEFVRGDGEAPCKHCGHEVRYHFEVMPGSHLTCKGVIIKT